MTDSLQLETTKSGLRERTTPPLLDAPLRWGSLLCGQGQEGRIFGSLQVVQNGVQKRPYLLTKCLKCGEYNWVISWNLVGRARDGCQNCSSTNAELSWLTSRFVSRKLMCGDKQNPTYGGRGIEFRFKSAFEAAVWMRDNCGLEPQKEIDRIDNNGHYEPGNLRWSTKSENNRNTRATVLREWDQNDWPYCEGMIRQLVAKGMSRTDIFEHARKVVANEGPWWKTIERRLRSTTS